MTYVQIYGRTMNLNLEIKGIDYISEQHICKNENGKDGLLYKILSSVDS